MSSGGPHRGTPQGEAEIFVIRTKQEAGEKLSHHEAGKLGGLTTKGPHRGLVDTTALAKKEHRLAERKARLAALKIDKKAKARKARKPRGKALAA